MLGRRYNSVTDWLPTANVDRLARIDWLVVFFGSYMGCLIPMSGLIADSSTMTGRWGFVGLLAAGRLVDQLVSALAD